LLKLWCTKMEKNVKCEQTGTVCQYGQNQSSAHAASWQSCVCNSKMYVRARTKTFTFLTNYVCAPVKWVCVLTIERTRMHNSQNSPPPPPSSTPKRNCVAGQTRHTHTTHHWFWRSLTRLSTPHCRPSVRAYAYAFVCRPGIDHHYRSMKWVYQQCMHTLLLSIMAINVISFSIRWFLCWICMGISYVHAAVLIMINTTVGNRVIDVERIYNIFYFIFVFYFYPAWYSHQFFMRTQIDFHQITS
jgi:hypothetical protein